VIEYAEIDPYNPRSDHIRDCAAALQRGQLVACPTDTTYGVFASAGDQKAVERLNRLRLSINADSTEILAVHEKPLSMIFPDFDMLKEYAVVPGLAFKVVKQLLPGPYTIILGAHRSVPKRLQSKRRFLGVRIPDHVVVQALLRAHGMPVLSTTLKDDDGELVSDAMTVADTWPHDIDLVLDAGLINPEPSTVLAFENGEAVIIRSGRGADAL